MELMNMQKGEASLEIKIEEAKVKVALVYDGKQADAKLEIMLGVDEYMDMLAKAIPGEVDDKIIEMLKLAMK